MIIVALPSKHEPKRCRLDDFIRRSYVATVKKAFLAASFLTIANEVAAAQDVADGGDEAAPKIQLALDLRDDSRIVGQPIFPESAGVRTKLADFDLPWQRIVGARADDEGIWSFEMSNRDRIKGELDFDRIKLETIFGQVDVPTHLIRGFDVDFSGAVPERGLVLHYPFKEPEQKIKDASGTENHAVNHGGRSVPQGVRGSALGFDGKSAMAEIEGEQIASLPDWENYTISVWFLNDGGGSQDRGYGQKIIDKTVMYHDFYLCVRATGALGFHTYEGNGAGMQDDSFDYRDGEWHHAVVIKKDSHGELWINGELKDSTEDLKRVKTPAPLLLGYSKSPDSLQRRHWSGMLDELRVYDRALSDREVAKLFRARR